MKCPSCERSISKKLAVYLEGKAKAAGVEVPAFVQERLKQKPRWKSKIRRAQLPKEVRESLRKYDDLKERLVRELGEHRAKLLMEE